MFYTAVKYHKDQDDYEMLMSVKVPRATMALELRKDSRSEH